MSRVGKSPVLIPQDVDCYFEGTTFNAKGKNGILSMQVSSEVSVSIEDQKVNVLPLKKSKDSLMMWGTTRRLIDNLIQGVHQGFTKKLEITGVGYRAAVQGNVLSLQLGYSHDINYPIPSDIKIVAEKPTLLSISGANRQRVGQVAADIRSYREPEPYKGKGVKYENEFILRKEGKKK